MSVHALMSLGFLGFASGGFGGSAPIPNGAQASGHVNSSVVDSQSADSQAPAVPAGVTIPLFTPAEFPFVTTIPDDGTGKAGGYQVAKVNLEFIRFALPHKLIKWYCPFTIQMPLRTEFMGKVDAIRAARLSAGIANGVASGIDYKLPQGLFCFRFMSNMDAAFKSTYPFLGAAATK